MTTTTAPQRATHDPHDAPEQRRRPSRTAVRLSLAALALGVGAGVAAAYVSDDGTADSPTSEWTSDDGLRWEHPDGRWYVVATPRTIGDR